MSTKLTMKLQPHHWRWALALAVALVVCVAGWSIAGFERLLRQGQTVLLELGPVDPRSLMQGDYMVLAYAQDEALQAQLKALHNANLHTTTPLKPRYAYLTLDAQQRATLHSVGEQAEPPSGTVAWKLRWAAGRVQLGPDSFFFQEGMGDVYAAARWGEFRLAADGRALLVALRDEHLQALGGHAQGRAP